MNVERVLLIVHRKAGAGGHAASAEDLRARLAASLPSSADLQLATTGDHAEVRERATAFLRASTAPAALLVGGGSGTLRAAVEACCELGEDGTPPHETRVRIAPLRMGSGNMVAKQLGYPSDPRACVDAAAAGLLADRLVPGCVVRVDAGVATGSPRTHFGLSMGGFGAFGRIARDVERWPRSWPRARRALGAVLGIETWTNVEYFSCIAARNLGAALSPSTCDRVRLVHDETSRELRLLAGLLFTFRIPQYPFDSGLVFGDARATLHAVELPASPLRRIACALVPPLLAGGATRIALEPGRDVRLELLDRPSGEFFLDEDPETFDGWLRISIAGTLALVPARAVA